MKSRHGHWTGCAEDPPNRKRQHAHREEQTRKVETSKDVFLSRLPRGILQLVVFCIACDISLPSFKISTVETGYWPAAARDTCSKQVSRAAAGQWQGSWRMICTYLFEERATGFGTNVTRYMADVGKTPPFLWHRSIAVSHQYECWSWQNKARSPNVCPARHGMLLGYTQQ